MRITTRLRIIASAALASVVVMLPILIWSLLEFESAKKDNHLADAIKLQFFESAAFRDQYFLYRENRVEALWNENKELAESLLSQARLQFKREDEQQLVGRLSKMNKESKAIFKRIVSNTDALKTATANRYIYEELDTRLSSQLLLKAVVIRDTTIALQEAAALRVEQTYKRLSIIIGLFALTLALATTLTLMQINRLIRKRVEPLHTGARIVAEGNLDYRITPAGSDEFSDIARSINAMTDKLQAFTRELEAEIDERKVMEEQVRQLAFHDLLTQLPNRRLLDDRLSQAMAASMRSACYGALMFLDLDNFKPLNDAYGHEVGDLLLIEVADRLKKCVRERDTVARFGGDEFVVMISELDVDQTESTAEACIVAEKIRSALSKPFVLEVQREGELEKTVEHHCTASIGVTLFLDHQASHNDILNWADTAMYQAKDAGRNLIRFHETVGS